MKIGCCHLKASRTERYSSHTHPLNTSNIFNQREGTNTRFQTEKGPISLLSREILKILLLFLILSILHSPFLYAIIESE